MKAKSKRNRARDCSAFPADISGSNVYFSCLCVCLSAQGKRLPAYLSADAEEGEVSDDDSADEIEDDFKLKNSNVS